MTVLMQDRVPRDERALWTLNYMRERANEQSVGADHIVMTLGLFATIHDVSRSYAHGVLEYMVRSNWLVREKVAGRNGLGVVHYRMTAPTIAALEKRHGGVS